MLIRDPGVRGALSVGVGTLVIVVSSKASHCVVLAGSVSLGMVGVLLSVLGRALLSVAVSLRVLVSL